MNREATRHTALRDSPENVQPSTGPVPLSLRLAKGLTATFSSCPDLDRGLYNIPLDSLSTHRLKYPQHSPFVVYCLSWHSPAKQCRTLAKQKPWGSPRSSRVLKSKQDLGDGSVLMSTCCSCKDSQFGSQRPHSGLQLLTIPAQGGPEPSIGSLGVELLWCTYRRCSLLTLHEHQASTICMYTEVLKAPLHRKINLLKTNT